jgi:hypothetical protein
MLLFPGFAFLYGALDGRSWSKHAVAWLITLATCVVGFLVGGNDLRDGGQPTRYALGWTVLGLPPVIVPAVVTQQWGRGGGRIGLSAEAQAVGLVMVFLMTFAVVRYFVSTPAEN